MNASALDKSKFPLRVVAGFQLFAGATGVASLPQLFHFLPGVTDPLLLFYLLLTVTNLAAGIMLWKLQKLGLLTSLYLQFFQIPVYRSASFPYNPLGLSFAFKEGWFGHDGVAAHELGVNVVAALLFIVLMKTFLQTVLNEPA